jgi:hypothetical protein
MKKATKLQLELERGMLASEASFLNIISAATRRANEHFWRDVKTNKRLRNRNKGEMYMLMVSELAEAFEAVRKSKVETMMDKHLPEYPAEVVELADQYIRMMDFVGEYYGDMFGMAVEAKRAYNTTRKDHTREHRMAPGGKAF